jgi:hypothetical protein
MATTTNYGWTTPDDTSLVKDGASAIRTLGSSIDTTVFNNASAGIAKTIVDAKGDLIAATAADTVSRLAVGTNGQVLTADSAEATGMKWGTVAAGGMTLLSTTTPSGSSTTVSSINQSYKKLVIFIQNITGTTSHIRIAPNGLSNCNFTVAANSSTPALYTGQSFGLGALGVNSPTTADTDAYYMEINNYASATYKSIFGFGGHQSNAAIQAGFINATTAVSSLVFSVGSGSFTGGTILIYGVN